MANERQIVTLVTLLCGLIVLFLTLNAIEINRIVSSGVIPLVKTLEGERDYGYK